MLEALLALLAAGGGFAFFNLRGKRPLRAMKSLLKPKHPGYDSVRMFYSLMVDIAFDDSNNPGKSIHDVQSFRELLPKDVSAIHLSNENLRYIEDQYDNFFQRFTRDVEKHPLEPDIPELENNREAYRDALQQIERKEIL